jgi:hypothetical protein
VLHESRSASASRQTSVIRLYVLTTKKLFLLPSTVDLSLNREPQEVVADLEQCVLLISPLEPETSRYYYCNLCALPNTMSRHCSPSSGREGCSST